MSLTSLCTTELFVKGLFLWLFELKELEHHSEKRAILHCKFSICTMDIHALLYFLCSLIPRNIHAKMHMYFLCTNAKLLNYWFCGMLPQTNSFMLWGSVPVLPLGYVHFLCGQRDGQRHLLAKPGTDIPTGTNPDTCSLFYRILSQFFVYIVRNQVKMMAYTYRQAHLSQSIKQW